MFIDSRVCIPVLATTCVEPGALCILYRDYVRTKEIEFMKTFPVPKELLALEVQARE